MYKQKRSRRLCHVQFLGRSDLPLNTGLSAVAMLTESCNQMVHFFVLVCMPVFFLDVREDEHVFCFQMTSVPKNVGCARFYITLVANMCKDPTFCTYELQT